MNPQDWHDYTNENTDKYKITTGHQNKMEIKTRMKRWNEHKPEIRMR